MDKIPIHILDAIRKFKIIIQKEITVKKVILFGSYSKGNYTETSDIDLCVITEHSENNFLLLYKIIPYTVDADVRIEPVVFSISEFENGNYGLIKEIKKSGIEIN